MAEHSCENCSFRARYDKNPKSLLGRLWRWHAGWCPGWKKYMASLPDAQRIELAKKYNLKKVSLKPHANEGATPCHGLICWHWRSAWPWMRLRCPSWQE